MTKAEERALDFYPLKDYTKEANYLHTCDTKTLDEVYRDVFKVGYEQAEKDTIERAIVWLEEHADSYIVDLTPTYPDAPQNIIIGGMCWEHLKQALEDEK